jgi:anthranilate synthase component 2
MAVMSRDGSVHGLQFHPESIMTPDGARMMENLLKSVREE